MVENRANTASQQIRNRLFKLTRYPWLVSVSEDQSVWVVRDLVGRRKKTAKIDLNIELQDGTRLTDPVNGALFEVTVEYVELVRLYQPEMNAVTHHSRATRLLVFVYWLTQRGIRSLNEVSEAHLTLFFQNLEFGTEWVLGMPHRLIRFMQQEARKGNALPLNDRGTIDLRTIFRQERIHWQGTLSGRTVCHQILRWVDTHPGELDTQTSPEELIERMGWKPKRRTGKYLAQTVKPVEEIWAWRDDFRVNIENTKLDVYGMAKKARDRGRSPSHYATIPPEIAFAYLRGALQWVVTFAPIFLEAQRRDWTLEKTQRHLAEGGLDIELTRPGRAERLTPDHATPDRFLRLTAAACFVVIAGLSARRIGEIMDLGAHCTFVDIDEHHWIRIYIEKTLRTTEQMPIPTAVHHAIECLEEISAEARAETGHDTLWQYRTKKTGRCVGLYPDRELNNLSRFLGEDVDKRWKFHPHQFRRFFAMVYFWRYEPGDVAALAHHLRHFELEMTRQYVTDDGFSRIWQDVAEERQRDVLASVVDGTRWVGGPGGEQLKARIDKLKHQYRRDVQVVPAYRIIDKLLRLAKKWGSACKLHAWGTICVCPQKGSPNQGRHAHCKGPEERGPVFSQATVATCARYPYAVHTERFESAARTALAEQESTKAGFAQGTLLKGFLASSCNDLRKALESGKGMPTKGG